MKNSSNLTNITIIIPTYNEEVNLPQLLDGIVGWASQIIVIDSFSQDDTVNIAKKYGVEVYENKYENMAQQRLWGMTFPNIKNEWIFNLDADEQVTSDLKKEINEFILNAEDSISGALIRRRHYFLGKWMRHGGDYIWLLRLVRKGRCRVIKTPIINEHTIVSGKVIKFKNDFIHNPKKDLTAWIQRVNTGAQKFALFLKSNPKPNYPKLEPNESIEGSLRTMLNYSIYAKIPLSLRPYSRFIVFYIFRGGFLDGWQGLVYHVINDFMYPFIVWAKCKEYQKDDKSLNVAEKASWR